MRMDHDIDPALVAAFGSETRVRVLAVLANAFRPFTAYRVGKVGGVPLPKAYAELRRLATARLVSRHGTGWVLDDRDIASLLRRRVRISWQPDWAAERARRAAEMARRYDQLKKIRHADPPKGFVPRDPARLVRDPMKDVHLRRMGLVTSLHGE